MSTMDAINRALQQAKSFAAGMIRRGELSVSPQSFFCQLAGYDDELFDDVELWAHFGLASRPPTGTQALTVHLNGQTEEAIAVATESMEDRPTDLDEGEAVLYGKKATTGGQAQVRVKADGSVAVVAGTLADISVTAGAAKKVTIDPLAEVCGATDAMLKGTSFNLAHKAVLEVLKTYVDGIKNVTEPGATHPLTDALKVAIDLFNNTAAPAALSAKAKVG